MEDRTIQELHTQLTRGYCGLDLGIGCVRRGTQQNERAVIVPKNGSGFKTECMDVHTAELGLSMLAAVQPGSSEK